MRGEKERRACFFPENLRGEERWGALGAKGEVICLRERVEGKLVVRVVLWMSEDE